MKRLLILTAFITTAAPLFSTWAEQVKSNISFSIQPDDGSEAFVLEAGEALDLVACQQGNCYIEYKGEVISLPEDNVEPYEEEAPRRRTNPTFSVRSTQQETSELGASVESTEPEVVVRRLGMSSSYNSCFTEHKNKYTSILYCKNSEDVRYPCGTKATTTSKGLCYKGVKHLLLKCGAVDGYLSGGLAKEAGSQLLSNGYQKLDIMDPRMAPPGSVIVYDNACPYTHEAGHIEIKISETQWVSDFINSQPINEQSSCRPVKAVYFK